MTGSLRDSRKPIFIRAKDQDISTGKSETITLGEVNIGPDIGLGGYGICIGGYKIHDDLGIFVGLTGGVLGQHGTVGVGASLKPVLNEVGKFFDSVYLYIQFNSLGGGAFGSGF